MSSGYVSTSLDGDQQKKISFLLQTGMASSALEHSVPEQLFSTAENQVEGVSAVKALKIANDQGIPIYTVNKTNIATVLPQLQIDQQVKADIQNAVNAGKMVTVSKTDITYKGWTGIGYIIIDPTTGAGAYMIGGGLSGSVFSYNFWSVMLGIAYVVRNGAAILFSVLLIAAFPVIIAAIADIIFQVGLILESLLLVEEEVYLLWKAWLVYDDMSPQDDSLLPNSSFEWTVYFITWALLRI